MALQVVTPGYSLPCCTDRKLKTTPNPTDITAGAVLYKACLIDGEEGLLPRLADKNGKGFPPEAQVQAFESFVVFSPQLAGVHVMLSRVANKLSTWSSLDKE